MFLVRREGVVVRSLNNDEFPDLNGDEPSTGRALSADQFVSEIAYDLNITDAKIRSKMTRWCWNALFLLNAKVAFKIERQVLGLNFEAIVPRAPKPCDYVSLIRAWIGATGADGKPINARIPFFEPIHVGLCDLLRKHGCKNRNRKICNPHYQIQEQTFWFDLSTNVGEGDFLFIEYAAFNLDPTTGQPVFTREWLEPCKLYVHTCLASQGLQEGRVSIDELTKHYALTAKLGKVAKSMENSFELTEDGIDQMMAKFRDPYYLTDNPYLMGRYQQNLNLERFAYGSPGYGYPSLPDKT